MVTGIKGCKLFADVVHLRFFWHSSGEWKSNAPVSQ